MSFAQALCGKQMTFTTSTTTNPLYNHFGAEMPTFNRISNPSSTSEKFNNNGSVNTVPNAPVRLATSLSNGHSKNNDYDQDVQAVQQGVRQTRIMEVGDVERSIMGRFKRFSFNVDFNGRIMDLTSLYSTLRTPDHFIVNSTSVVMSANSLNNEMKHQQKYDLQYMFNSGKNSITASRNGELLKQFDSDSLQQCKHLTPASLEMLRFILQKCPGKENISRRGYYENESVMLVHRVSYSDVDVYHDNSDAARGQVAVKLYGQVGPPSDCGLCLLKGDNNEYDGILGSGKEQLLYYTETAVMPDYEAIHGIHSKENFHEAKNKDPHYRVHLASPFFIFISYHMDTLIKEYFSANSAFPTGVTEEIYAQLCDYFTSAKMSQTVKWVQMYDEKDLVNNVPYYVMDILKKCHDTYWKVSVIDVSFIIPDDFAKLCAKSFHRGNSNLRYVDPTQMALATKYKPGLPSERSDDVSVKLTLKSLSFRPFSCFYITEAEDIQGSESN